MRPRGQERVDLYGRMAVVSSLARVSQPGVIDILPPKWIFAGNLLLRKYEAAIKYTVPICEVLSPIWRKAPSIDSRGPSESRRRDERKECRWVSEVLRETDSGVGAPGCGNGSLRSRRYGRNKGLDVSAGSVMSWKSAGSVREPAGGQAVKRESQTHHLRGCVGADERDNRPSSLRV